MNSDMTVLSAAVGMISNAVSTARNAVELAKSTGNHDLKTAVSDVLSDVLDLKLKVAELGDENRKYRELNETLEAKLKEQVLIKRDPQFGYWFKEGDADPLCPKCYESEARRVCHLSRVIAINASSMGRTCCQCDYKNAEEPRVRPSTSSEQRKGYWQ